MKNYISLMIIVLLIGCKKDDISDHDSFYTDFHDTLLAANGINIQTSYNLDLDKDDIFDLSINIKDGYSNIGSFDYYIQIDTKNNFEILYSNIIDTTYEWAPGAPDTSYHYYSVLMPKINNINDTININDNFTSDSIMLVYNLVPHPMVRPYSKGISRNQWVGIGYKYIAFRNIIETNKKLGLLKVNVLSSTEIIISSCRYCKEGEIVINEN